MNRRHFLALGGFAVSVAASWRLGSEAAHSSLTPTGADAICEKRPLAPLAHYQRLAFPDARQAALYAMQAVHREKPYGVTQGASTVDEFLKLERSECGTYTRVQDQVSQYYGLTTRRVRFTDSWHGFLEIEIGGTWEVFDSTANVWIDKPMEVLLTGEPRRYSMYYSPIFDPDAPDVYRAHLREGWNVPALRARLPFLGLERGITFPPLDSF